MMYQVELGLSVTGPERAEHFQHVVDCYAALEEAHDELLDCSFSFADAVDHATVDVELTVTAETEDDAFALANSSVRSAIQAAGGFTLDWDERRPDSAVYRLTGESVGLIDA